MQMPAGSRPGLPNVAVAIRAKMQPVGWEKGLAPRPAFVRAKTQDLIALHRTAVLLVAAFLIVEAMGRGEIAKSAAPPISVVAAHSVLMVRSQTWNAA
jgi:hypothetical protein